MQAKQRELEELITKEMKKQIEFYKAYPTKTDEMEDVQRDLEKLFLKEKKN